MSTLKRGLTLPHMVLYGLGTTIGAGIYALAGEIAGISGYLAPAAFLFAALLAALTACSFAELSGRFPKAAGAALYIEKGFAKPRLSLLIGLMVCMAGIVSAAALINAFVNYLSVYINSPRLPMIIALSVFIGFIAIWGIVESVTIAAIITLVETSGLLTIIFVSRDAYNDLPQLWHHLLPQANFSSLTAVSSGAVLAFYAFIGFEDMVEVAEEVHHVERTLPLAILVTIAITTVLYLLIMLAAVLSLPPSSLAQSNTPLAYLYQSHTGKSADFLNAIAMIAVLNGAIIQMIMSSRVLYGLSSRGKLPHWLASIHPKTRTPVKATLTVMFIVLTLALAGNLSSLAEITSLLVLGTFALVNLSLWKMKKHTPRIAGVFCIPRIFPLLGFLSCLGFVLGQMLGWLV